ncbi:MAG: hypothetical protein ABJC98_09520 [Bacteroidota bacterium]
MIKLSLWAKGHPAKARTVIILMHIVLNALAVYTGFALMQLDISMPAVFVYVTILLFFTAVLLYPRRHCKNVYFNKRQLYSIRKSCDFTLGICSFIFVCFAANNYKNDANSIAAFTAEAASFLKGGEKPTASAILASLSFRDKKTLTGSEKRILKAEFRHQLKVYVKAKLTKDDEAAAKSVFIILSIIGAIGLTVLLAGLACNISCNGSEAAAIILFIVGLSAIIWTLILVIKTIKRHKKKGKEASTQVKPDQ